MASTSGVSGVHSAPVVTEAPAPSLDRSGADQFAQSKHDLQQEIVAVSNTSSSLSATASARTKRMPSISAVVSRGVSAPAKPETYPANLSALGPQIEPEAFFASRDQLISSLLSHPATQAASKRRLEMVRRQINASVQKQLAASDRVFAQSKCKSAEQAAKEILQLDADMEYAKKAGAALDQEIADLGKELAEKKSASSEDVANREKLQAAWSRLKDAAADYPEKSQGYLLELHQRISAAQKKTQAAKDKVFASSRFKTEPAARLALFTKNHSIRAAQEKIDAVGASDADKCEAMVTLVQAREAAWRIHQLLRQAEIAQQEAIGHEAKAVQIMARRIVHRANQSWGFYLLGATRCQTAEGSKLSIDLSNFLNFDTEALKLLLGFPAENTAGVQQWASLCLKREEMLHFFAQAKVKKDQVTQVQDLAQAASLFAARKACIEIRDQLFKAAASFSQAKLGKTQEITEATLARPEVQLRLMAVEFDASAKRYQALATECEMRVHVRHQNMHALRLLVAQAISGTTVAHETAYELAGGAGVGQVNIAKASLTVGIGLGQNESYSLDYDTDIVYLYQTCLSLFANIALKFGPAQADFGARITATVGSNFFSAPGGEAGLESAQRFALLQENRRNLFIRGSLRSNQGVKKLYWLWAKISNVFSGKNSTLSLNPYFPFTATEKTFSQAQGTEHVRFLSRAEFDKPAAGSGRRLDQAYSNAHAAPVSIPAAASQAQKPEASPRPLQVLALQGNAELGASTSNLVSSQTSPTDTTGMAFASLVPDIGAQVRAVAEASWVGLKLQKLNPVSLGALPQSTGSLAVSQQLADDILTQVWEAKAGNGPLPSELQAAKDLFVEGKSANTASQKMQLDYVSRAIWSLTDLSARLHQLEQLSAQMLSLHKYATRDGVLRLIYQQKLAELHDGYQLPGDRLPSNARYTAKGLSYAIGRAWAHLDSAMLFTSQGVMAALSTAAEIGSDTEAALAVYDEVYTQSVMCLRRFNGPFTEDGLWRHTELQTQTVMERTQKSAAVHLFAGLRLPMPARAVMPQEPSMSGGLDADASGAPAPGLSLTSGLANFLEHLALTMGAGAKFVVQDAKQSKHSNPARAGNFHTVSADLSLSSLKQLLGPRFASSSRQVHTALSGMVAGAGTKAVIADQASTPMFPGTKNNLGFEAIWTLLGWNSLEASIACSSMFRNDKLQYIELTASTSDGRLNSMPDLPSALGTGASLSASMNTKQTQTKVVLIMGPDLCINILQAGRLATAGLGKSAVTLMKSYLAQEDIASLAACQKQFFTHLAEHPETAASYFGGDAIRGVLAGFSEMDCKRKTQKNNEGNLVLLDGFELFNEDVALEYGVMEREARWSSALRVQAKEAESMALEAWRSAEADYVRCGESPDREKQATLELAQRKLDATKILYEEAQALVAACAYSQLKQNTSVLPSESYIAAQMGLTQERVRNLLKQPYPAFPAGAAGHSVEDFLLQASPGEKIAFYQNDPIGIQLFTAYVLIISQGSEICAMYASAKGYARLVSQFSKRTATARE
jgi:hypothetical protein